MTFGRSSIRCAVLGLSLGAVARAAADDAEPGEAPGETIVIIDRVPGEAARDRARALGDAPFMTVVHADEHPAAASVADAVGTVAGAHTRSLGGLGAYASVTVRGAAPGHTAVLIDGVPLARIAAVTTDLGRFSLDAFGEVELYRGAVPVELGGAGLGGALNLVTRLGRGAHGERVSGSLGAGSFGARHARLRYGDHAGTLDGVATLGYESAAGDYTYFDDNATPLNRADDGYRVRRNNGFHAVDGATRWATADRGAAFGLRAAYKRQGLPGSTSQPALAAELATTDVIGDGGFDAAIGGATAHQLAYVLVEHQHLDDPRGELGLGASDRDYLTFAVGASSTWRFALGPHRGIAGAELRAERFRDRDDTGAQPVRVGDRLAGAVAVACDLVIDPPAARLVVTPAVRLDLVRTAPTPMASSPELAVVPARRDVVPSPRLSARLAATGDVAIKGSAGWYVRLPTLVEVFGDRGYIVGSPSLEPERGPSGDLGAVWAPAGAEGDLDRIFVAADLFAHRAHDTIAFITAAGLVAHAANIGDTEAIGGELVASARYARLISATVSYTGMVTAQRNGDPSLDGEPVPREPSHALHARVELAHRVLDRRAAVWLDAALQSSSTLDPGGRGQAPGRALLGAGVRVELVHGLAAALTVANLTDHRLAHVALDPPPSPSLTEAPVALTDVAGFPLPGRSFDLSLDWTY